MDFHTERTVWLFNHRIEKRKYLSKDNDHELMHQSMNNNIIIIFVENKYLLHDNS